jgi:dolichyl-phosphate-mannose--protein O-mannosyl transferase
MPALLAAAIMGFIFFAPFTYGLHLSKSGLDAHFWLDSWR